MDSAQPRLYNQASPQAVTGMVYRNANFHSISFKAKTKYMTETGSCFPLSQSEHELGRLDSIPEVDAMIRVTSSRLHWLLNHRHELWKEVILADIARREAALDEDRCMMP